MWKYYIELDNGKLKPLAKAIKDWKTGSTVEKVLRDCTGQIVLFDKNHIQIGRY
jgi:hypothetical protein